MVTGSRQPRSVFCARSPGGPLSFSKLAWPLLCQSLSQNHCRGSDEKPLWILECSQSDRGRSQLHTSFGNFELAGALPAQSSAPGVQLSVLGLLALAPPPWSVFPFLSDQRMKIITALRHPHQSHWQVPANPTALPTPFS